MILRVWKALVLQGLRIERQTWEAVPEDRLLVSAEWRDGYVEGLAMAEQLVRNGGKKRYGT